MQASKHVMVVAELGANHSQSLDRARRIVHAAVEAGADAFKIQIFEPQDLTIQSESPEFRITDGLWAGWSLWDLYARAALPMEWIAPLKSLAESLGLVFVASVYNPRTVKIAEDNGVEILKIASFEAGWKNLLDAIHKTGKPVIMSSGTSALAEIEIGQALFQGRLTLLRCVSKYPAPIQSFNLLTIPDLIRRFPACRIGLSDHSCNPAIPVAAVALGATMIEVHIKPSPDDDGLDAAFSVDPIAFKEMVKSVRDTEAALGKVDYTPSTTQFKRRFTETHGWVRTVN